MNDGDETRNVGGLSRVGAGFRPGALVRYAVILLGALVITAGLLLAMQRASDSLKHIDPLRYFAVADFIAAPSGRRLPKAPPQPEREPARPGLSYATPAGRVPSEDDAAATPDVSVAPAPVPVEPELDSAQH